MGYDLCLACAAEEQNRAAGMPGMRRSVTWPRDACLEQPRDHSLPESVMAGDIFFCGPDKWGIHHAVLSCGEMSLADSDVVDMIRNDCDLSSDMEIFTCTTVEVTREYEGSEFPWYKAQSFFACDPCGRLSQVADIAEGTNRITFNVAPIPAKLLLHPLREREGLKGSPFKPEIFAEAIELCARNSQSWSKKTALKAIAAGRMSRLNAGKYATSESRTKLMEELRSRWEERPICSSVAILVWQRYFQLAAGDSPEGDNLAVEQILQWMPVFNDTTAPSALVNVLSTCGWVLRECGLHG